MKNKPKAMERGTGQAEPTVRSALLEELALRRSANRSFSMRAFARYLGIPSSTLKYLMDGSRQPVTTTLNQIAGRLNWSPEKVAKLKLSFRAKKKTSAGNYRNDLALIRDTATLAVYSLAGIPGAAPDPGMMAQRLGISRKRAAAALEMLSAAGVLRLEGGAWRPGEYLPQVISSAEEVRKYRESVYRHALKQLDRVGQSEGGNLIFHLPLTAGDMPRVLKRINTFRHHLAREFTPRAGSDVFYGIFSIFPFREIPRKTARR